MWKSLFRRQLLELLGFLQQALGMNASGPAGSQGKIQRRGQCVRMGQVTRFADPLVSVQLCLVKHPAARHGQAQLSRQEHQRVDWRQLQTLVNPITETIEADRYPFSPRLREGGSPGLCIGASEGTES